MSKPPSPANDSSETASSGGGLTRYQKFKPLTIRRDQLKEAPYNPRKIDAHARRKLEKSLKRHGLVETIVYNERTGNIVGGHQRLSIIDALEKRPDYELTVAAIDVDEQTERELNILLNNPNAQAEWDLEKLAQLLAHEVEVENTGFDPIDLEIMFDDKDLSRLFAAENDPAKPIIEDLAANKEKYKALKLASAAAAAENSDPEFYVVLVFADRAEVEAFCKLIGQPEERYLNGRRIAAMIPQETGQKKSPEAEASGDVGQAASAA
jgi:hypothetical protein